MKWTIALFAMALACIIAMSSPGAAAQNNAEQRSSAVSPIVVAQAQPTDADKRKLSDEIQRRYKPGSGASGAKTPMSSGNTCGGTGQIAACSVSCSAACIFKCTPPAGTPWGSDCKACVTPCMDKCTGCGSGSVN